MKAEQVVLTKRLAMLADMITPGNRLVDVGCDHGFLPLYALQQGICPMALAMDVRMGPLEAAKRHIEEAGLTECISIRQSDGLKEYQAGEGDTLVIAGMGGPLMGRILMDSIDKVRSLKELILQPQSEITQFREFLRRNGMHIVEEDAVVEEGKYYFAMKVLPQTQMIETTVQDEELQSLYDAYGEHLLQGRHPVLKEFLDMQLTNLKKLEGELRAVSSEKATQRLPQIQQEIRFVERALDEMAFDL